MSKRKKRLERLRRNPKNVKFEDLRRVLLDFGFQQTRSSGSHHSFHLVIDEEIKLFVVPYRRPIKTVYVREALKLIDKLIASQQKDEDENE